MLARNITTATGIASTVGILVAAPSNALPSNGSLPIPDDVAPGNYWATPTDSYGGLVQVCADYTCDPGPGMLNSYPVEGRTMIVVPPNAIMVNVHRADLSPAGV